MSIARLDVHITVLMLVAWCAGVVGAVPLRAELTEENSGRFEIHSVERVDFNLLIRPLFSQKCYACHGPDEASREGGLALHDRASAIGELDSGERGIVPGDAAASELFRRISASGHERMPPTEFAEALTPTEIELIRRWIDEGAEYQLHWSFQPIIDPEVPTPRKPEWIRNPIDAFVLQQLELANLEPAPEAPREQLIRRLSLDLIGLPPSPDEIKQFAADTGVDAYERLVDRLLASPRFGEHWATHWLDLARYADSQGYAQDEIRTIWPYRDWVIKAINDDLPFDQFTIEQLAGDLLNEPSQSQLVATGFHRNTMTNTEGGTDDEEFRYAAVVDRVNTTSQVWLGLTMGCAQCHSHKFDPITHLDYYQFLSIFNQTADNDQPNNSPTISYVMEQQYDSLKELNGKLATLLELNPERPDDVARHARELAEIKQQLVAIETHHTPIMQQLSDGHQRKTHVALRGSYLSPGEEAHPRLPAFLRPASVGYEIDSDTNGSKPSRAPDPFNRLDLAIWLVSPENSLTARVEANRIWEQIFGNGIVGTSEDFGAQGSLPSHPELLDWLAIRLVESGWSRKQLCRIIVMSATYRQASILNSEKLVRDPHNRLYSRGSRYRLSAEQLRDYALAAGGILSDKMYGPPVRPPQPKLGLSAAFGGSLDWDPSAGEDRFRRGIYTLLRRTHPYPSFVALDATDRRVCTTSRTRTNTPVGAFVTLNDPVYVEAAVATALRIVDQTTGDSAGTEFAFLAIVGRMPLPSEQGVIEKLLADQLEHYAQDVTAAKTLIAVHEPTQSKSDSEAIVLAAWTVVANTLLNLDEALTRN